MSLHRRHHGTSSSRQYVFALAVTVFAIVVVYFALRAIPSADRPTLGPVSSPATAHTGP